MSTCATLIRRSVLLLLVLGLSLLTACGKKEATPPATTEQAGQRAAPALPVSSPDEPPAPSNGMVFPKGFKRASTGDFSVIREMGIVPIDKRTLAALAVAWQHPPTG
jgi:hypothetical protein